MDRESDQSASFLPMSIGRTHLESLETVTTEIQLVRSSSLFSGAPYAYAAQAPPGSQFVFLAGACPLDTEGNTVGPGNYVLQAQTALANMELALAAAAASITDVIFTRVLVATGDRDDLLSVWTVVAEWFGHHDAPSTLVGVTVLGYRDQLVEIEAVAALSAA
jgi:enamine deaminase RidA (YjgF/YER057c/UK114 family)